MRLEYQSGIHGSRNAWKAGMATTSSTDPRDPCYGDEHCMRTPGCSMKERSYGVIRKDGERMVNRVAVLATGIGYCLRYGISSYLGT